MQELSCGKQKSNSYRYHKILIQLFNMLSPPETLSDKKHNLLIHLKMLALAKCYEDKRLIKGLKEKIDYYSKDIENEDKKTYSKLF